MKSNILPAEIPDWKAIAARANAIIQPIFSKLRVLRSVDNYVIKHGAPSRFITILPLNYFDISIKKFIII